LERSLCPCCGNRLRTKPRNKIFKLALRENQKILPNTNHK
jgi:hypothetical protein